MTSVRLEFDLQDDDILTQMMILEQRLSSSGLGEFLESSVHPYLEDRTRDRFANEGDDAVGKWLALSFPTRQIRANLGYGASGPINVRTRDMINYMLNGSADVIVASHGADLAYPSHGAMPPDIQQKIQTAQSGKPSPRTPPRPVVALSQADDRAITYDLATYIMGGLTGQII